MHKVEQNYTHTHTHTHTHTQNPTKCPKFKCNRVSVSFSACRCNSVVLSSKVGRKREKKKKTTKKESLETVLRMVSAAVACLTAAVSLLLLDVLFMQIFGVSLALTWPCRLCLLRFLLCGSLCYKLSPFRAPWER
jgi:peptidoglycan biosynthesis protein MviN/MurJ (putative lipid II flippase)